MNERSATYFRKFTSDSDEDKAKLARSLVVRLNTWSEVYGDPPIENLLYPEKTSNLDRYDHPNFTINFRVRVVYNKVTGKTNELVQEELNLIERLEKEENELVAYNKVILSIWNHYGPDVSSQKIALRTILYNLRLKIDPPHERKQMQASAIRTIPSKGLKLVNPQTLHAKFLPKNP